MKLLATLTPVPRTDVRVIRDLYPEESLEHPGRMRTALAREVIRYFLPEARDRLESIIVDPMVGIGTTCVASVLEGCHKFVGCDMVNSYVQLAKEARFNAVKWFLETEPFALRNMEDSSCCRSVIVHCRSQDMLVEPYIKGKKVPLLLTSPPFPESHSQGDSDLQDEFQGHKKTYAGNEFEEQEKWRDFTSFCIQLQEVLEPWVPHLPEGAAVAVHIKNHIRDGKEVEVHKWVAAAIDSLGLDLEGYLRAPLAYRSMFRELQRYPLRLIERVERHGDGTRTDYLECGHSKGRDNDPDVKQARCKRCGPKKGHVEIREEKIVVARKRAAISNVRTGRTWKHVK